MASRGSAGSERGAAPTPAGRTAAQRSEQRRSPTYALTGIGLVAFVVIVVMLLMSGTGGSDGGRPSRVGDVTVQGAPRAAPLGSGEPVPAYEAPALDGGTIAWSDYRGKSVILSVWAPWCPHCQVELPVLDRIMKGYPDVDLTTIATSIDPAHPPTPEAFMSDRGLSFPVAVDDANGTLARAFGIQGFPTLYFVNSDGTVTGELEGEVDEATLRAAIASLG